MHHSIASDNDRATVRRRFYPLIAMVLATFVVIGFSRTYYLRFLSDRPPLHAILHVHGLVFTAWLALFIAQTQLIARRRVDLHMKLGVAGAVLAVFVVATGLVSTLVGAAVPRMTQLGVTTAQATIVPLVSIIPFAILVPAAIAWRRRPSLHKRLMLLAMISMLGPPTARLIAMLGGREHALLLQMGTIAAFVTACLVYDWRKHRTVHPVFAIGGPVLVLLWPARYVIARSEAWRPIGEWIAEWGRQLG
ncbi:MAG TPA: hypothetical protein VFV88_05785 [Steroidobacteraceae bacterium]|nr:hypothetical protein [Steroidobacteraceae bacterium]